MPTAESFNLDHHVEKKSNQESKVVCQIWANLELNGKRKNGH